MRENGSGDVVGNSDLRTEHVLTVISATRPTDASHRRVPPTCAAARVWGLVISRTVPRLTS
jgi:hypothetical protein